MKKLVLICLLFHSLNSVAQDEPKKIIDQFFSLYKTKSSDAALDYIFSTNKWMQESKDQIENVKFKINSQLVKSMGDYHGYEPITQKSVGNDLLYFTYLVKYDRQPIRFTFVFYNPNHQWRLQNFSFDDRITEELEEASKIYRLKQNLEY